MEWCLFWICTIRDGMLFQHLLKCRFLFDYGHVKCYNESRVVSGRKSMDDPQALETKRGLISWTPFEWLAEFHNPSSNDASSVVPSIVQRTSRVILVIIKAAHFCPLILNLLGRLSSSPLLGPVMNGTYPLQGTWHTPKLYPVIFPGQL